MSKLAHSSDEHMEQIEREGEGRQDEPQQLGTIRVCQGPPRCSRMDSEAVFDEMRQCPFCTVIRQWSDGTDAVAVPYSDTPSQQ